MPSLIGPPTLATTNPYSDAYNALWALLNSNSDFAAMFGESDGYRQISLDASNIFASNPDLGNPAPADFPRIRIAVMDLEPLSEVDSTSCQDELVLEIQVCTGSQQQGMLLDCVWPIRRAMLSWRQYVRDVVTWNGEPCVFDVDSKPLKIKANHVEGEDKDNMPEESRGYEQWIGLWRTTIRFYFQTTAMRGI